MLQVERFFLTFHTSWNWRFWVLAQPWTSGWNLTPTCTPGDLSYHKDSKLHSKFTTEWSVILASKLGMYNYFQTWFKTMYIDRFLHSLNYFSSLIKAPLLYFMDNNILSQDILSCSNECIHNQFSQCTWCGPEQNQDFFVSVETTCKI